MEPTRTMYWTCPKCRTPNTQQIPDDTKHGKLIDVRCAACRERYDATAIEHSHAGRPPEVFGVTWV